MEAGGELSRIDWGAPWFAPWGELGRGVAARIGAGASHAQALDAGGRAPVRFVPQGELIQGHAYETFIRGTGACPTRDNLHDFFNGLAWLRFPRAKSRLNVLQSDAIAGAGIGGTRGPVRDAVTLLDENGALLDAPEPLWEALRGREWKRLFVDLRPLWKDARLVVFGHALLEKLVRPRKDLTAHVWCMPVSVSDLDAADAALAGQLSAGSLAAKPFTPLPVLGVPGWWAENENFSFYDDSFVFRPAGHRTHHNQPVRRRAP